MWRWLPCVLFLCGGLGALYFGVVIELEVQYEIGNWERAAQWLYGDEIDGYRQQVMYCWIAGPLCVLLAYLCRPSGRRAPKESQTRP